MSEITKRLAELRQEREQPQESRAPERREEKMVQVGAREEKTLAGRVPLALHRELMRGLMDAADELGYRRVYMDEALEAAVRLVLHDPDARERWLREIETVRSERRE